MDTMKRALGWGVFAFVLVFGFKPAGHQGGLPFYIKRAVLHTLGVHG